MTTQVECPFGNIGSLHRMEFCTKRSIMHVETKPTQSFGARQCSFCVTGNVVSIIFNPCCNCLPRCLPRPSRKRGAMASASVFGSGLTSIDQHAEGCRFESGRFRFRVFAAMYCNFNVLLSAHLILSWRKVLYVSVDGVDAGVDSLTNGSGFRVS